jgi:DNA-binding response OmpR family regulator
MTTKTKILIAEDTLDLLELLSDRLNYEGYQVVKAVDGQDAWEKIQHEDPDVILLDLMMPKMDGWTLLEKLRKSPPSKKYQPVIIVSALNELQDLKKGFSLEADHYITKPWEMADILKGIKQVLQLAKSRVSESDHPGTSFKPMR